MACRKVTWEDVGQGVQHMSYAKWALMYNNVIKVKNPLWLSTYGNSMWGEGAEFWLYFAGTSQEDLVIK